MKASILFLVEHRMIKKLSEIEREREFFDRRHDLNSVMPVVREIITTVKKRGDDALREYTLKFDSVRLDEIEVSEEEKEAAKANADSELKLYIGEAFNRIRNFHHRQKKAAWVERFAEGVYIGELYRPFEVVGAYVPAAYFSTALMCVTPAKVAG
ncbi:histidinol dehydrogenase, partial [Methanosarcinales archaeon]